MKLLLPAVATASTSSVVLFAQPCGSIVSLDRIIQDRYGDICWWWLLTNDGNAKRVPIVNREGTVVENHIVSVGDYGVASPMIILTIPKPNQ